MEKRGFRWLAFAAVAAIALSGAGIWYYYGRAASNTSQSASSNSQSGQFTLPMHTTSSYVLVGEDRTVAGQESTTQLEIYDIQANRWSEMSLYDSTGSVTASARSILSHVISHPSVPAWGGVGSSSLPSAVNAVVGSGMTRNAVAISPDGNFIIFDVFKDLCGTQKGTTCGSPADTNISAFYIYSKNDGTVVPLSSIKNLPFKIIGTLVWSPDQRTLYDIPANGLTFYAINWNGRAYARSYTITPDHTVLYHTPSIDPRAFAPSHDGTKIAVSVVWSGVSNDLSLWQQMRPTSTYGFYSQAYMYVLNVSTGENFKSIESGYQLRGIAFSPDDSKIAASVWRREPVDATNLEVFDASTLKMIWSSATDTQQLPTDLEFSPDSNYLYIGDGRNLQLLKFNGDITSQIAPSRSSARTPFFVGWLPINK